MFKSSSDQKSVKTKSHKNIHLSYGLNLWEGFPQGASGKEPACQCRIHGRWGFNLWIERIPWRRAWQPTPVFLPGESHGQRSLEAYIGSQTAGHNWSNLTYTQWNECCSNDLGRRLFVLDDHNALSFSPEMSSVKLQWQYYRCPRVVNKVVPPNASCCGRRLLEPLNSALHWYPARPLWAVCVLTLSWPLRQRWGFKFLTADILEAPDRHSLSLSVRSPPQGPTLIAPVGKHIGLWAPCLPCFPSLTSHPSYSAQPGWGRMRSQPLKAVLTKMSLEKLSARRPLYRDAGHGMGHIGQWAWPLNPGNASLGWWLLWVLLVHLQYQSCPPPPTSCSKKSSLMTPAIFHCRDRSANMWGPNPLKERWFGVLSCHG